MYCPFCEADREFRSENREETFTVRGEAFNLPVTVDICTACGEDRSDEKRDSELLARVYDEYRSRHVLLLADDIRRIREQYDLSQQSLAALLGMSPATINRYEAGALQEATHDNVIRMAAQPAAMWDLIERRGHLLPEQQRERVVQALSRAGLSV